MAYGGSQAGGQIGAVAAGLHHSHSNMGSELYLRPTPQLLAKTDPVAQQLMNPTSIHEDSGLIPESLIDGS